MNSSAYKYFNNTDDTSSFKLLQSKEVEGGSTSPIKFSIYENEKSKTSTDDAVIGPIPLKEDQNKRKKLKKKNNEKAPKEKVEKTEKKEKQGLKKDTIKVINDSKSSTKKEIILGSDSSKTNIKKEVSLQSYNAINKKNTDYKVYSEGIFQDNLLTKNSIQPKIRHLERGDWLTLLLIFIVSIICIINVFYRSRFKQLFNAFISNRFVGQIVREENIMFKRISIFLSILFLLVTSLFIYLMMGYFKIQFNLSKGFQLYMLIFLALLSFYFFKFILFNFLGILIRMEKEMKEYVFTIFLYNHFVGLALIIPVVLLAYVPGIKPMVFLLFGLFLFLCSFTVRTIRSYINVSGSGGISIFYLFLYLCTLEIMPLVIITKLISNIL